MSIAITLRPFGVLGTRLSAKCGLERIAPEPKHQMAFTDPAGLHYVQSGSTRGAGAASGAIYNFLNITHFPHAVVQAINQPGDAKYHAYDDNLDNNSNEKLHCIHVVGPDLRRGSPTWEDAVQSLSRAYMNVFREFDQSGLMELRLLPISGGVFAGPYSDRVAELSKEAISSALTSFASANPSSRIFCQNVQLHLCIFLEQEWQDFVDAGFHDGQSEQTQDED